MSIQTRNISTLQINNEHPDLKQKIMRQAGIKYTCLKEHLLDL